MRPGSVAGSACAEVGPAGRAPEGGTREGPLAAYAGAVVAALQGRREDQRLAALHRYDALTGEHMPELEAVARLAAAVCDVPHATVNLIDDRHQHQVATAGFPAGVVGRGEAMCTVALAEQGPVHVPDARRDPRWADNPHVNGERDRVVFYAASQLRTSEGMAVGTLCVYDRRVRELEQAQRQALDDLARQVVTLLEVRRDARALRDRNADLEAFAARLAHDLRSPMAAASGFLHLASNRFGHELVGTARTCVDGAVTGLQRANEMLEDLLSFASAGGVVDTAPVALRPLVEGVVVTCRADLEPAGAAVEVAVEPGTVVRTNAGAVRQVLQNLVVNAARYRQPGRAPRIRVGFRTGPDGWSLEVADNGRGIPVQDRERVLDVLVRGSNAGDVPGTGIGLATCARIARALGGTLLVGGEAGEGAVLTLQVRH